MPSATTSVLLTGLVAFSANYKRSNGFPKNGYRTITATLILAILLGMVDRTTLSPVVRAFAALGLLVALIRYIPAFSK